MTTGKKKRDLPAVIVQDVPARPQVLKKAVEAVYVKPLRGSITHTMHKAWNVLLARAAEQRKEGGGGGGGVYSMPLRHLSKHLAFASRNMEHLKETLRRLIATQVEWDTLSPEGEHAESERKWGVSTMLAGVEISASGVLEYSYAPQIEGRLLDPEVYVRLDLLIQNRFSSRAAQVLYEICMRYRTNPAQRTMVRHWTEWRDLLCGEPGKVVSAYPEWKYFNRDVLKPAIQEVNQVAEELQVQLILTKNGTRVDTLQFQLFPRQQRALPLDDGRDIFAPNEALAARMARLGLGREDATEICVYHEEADIVAALSVTELRMRNAKLEPLRSPAAYFKMALEKHFAPPAPAKSAPVLAAPRVAPKNYHLKIKPIKDYVAAMDPEALASLLREFEATLTEPTQRQLFARKGLNSAPIAGMFYPWLAARDGLVPAER